MIDYFPDIPPDPADSTSAVEGTTFLHSAPKSGCTSLRKTVYFLLSTTLLTFGGSLAIGFSSILQHTNYNVIFAAGVTHVFAGLSNFLFLVVYVSSITQEVLNKLKGETPLDEPLFYYSYGFPFALVIVAFLCVEVAAMLTLSVYMAHHDEKLWNRQRVRKLFRTGLLGGMVNMVGRRRSRQVGTKPSSRLGSRSGDDNTLAEEGTSQKSPESSVKCHLPTGLSRHTIMTDVSLDDTLDDADDTEEFVVHVGHPRYHSPIDYHINI